ncbi:ATP-dependent RNA helicase DDX1-like [Varroa destructor]|uniref:ATP-dependent RNA helicase n=1 Tax=Varroa destructor TaxID=109461 RepID=A0A7M7L057_VARDE|nr:ATP-dependent RNA helicase DDX1-like [Varroa destructor]XP_022673539.1 ATP-dependent RNA helicase DDX1-like [Varroa destructor]
MTAFEEMGVIPDVARAVDELDWNLPTDVQAEAIPLILGGGDVLMAAETGSGKTGAFSLPIVQIVWETMKDNLQGKSHTSSATGNVKLQLSFHDRTQQLAVSPDGLTAQARDPKGWHGCRATKAVSDKGKYYYEAKVTDEGLCRVGWSTQTAQLDLGTDKQGYGFGGTGKKSYNKNFDSYGEAFGIHDVIGCYLDLDNNIIKWSKNGVDFGTAFEIGSQLRNVPFFPAVVLKNAEMSFNFGAEPFKHPPENSYIAFANASNFTNNTILGSGPVVQKYEPHAPQAIILEPSRELADQTMKCLENFSKYLHEPRVKCLCITGGGAAQEQLNILKAGVDVVVGTPGRLEDLISSGKLSLNQCKFLVLDEADGLLSGGHGNLIERIHQRIPKLTANGKRLQMIVCSATLHSFEVKKLADKLMHFPTWVDLKGEDSVPETVHHVVCIVNPQKDESWRTLSRHITTDGVHARDSKTGPEGLSEAIKILKGEYCIRAIRKQKMDQGIIFCRTKLDCDNLEQYFQLHGGGPNARCDAELSCVCLHGDRKPHERTANLEKFKQKRVRFLICTDVAARGIDIKGVPYVINVTLPDDKANYVHRIGRVGRADRMGLAISLVASVPEKVWYHSNCANRGRGCYNTNLTDKGGCCIWYNEQNYLAEIEEHLKDTIMQVDKELDVPADEFDGKVTYGAKRKTTSCSLYANHVQQMAPTVADLAELEKQAQLGYLSLFHNVQA